MGIWYSILAKCFAPPKNMPSTGQNHKQTLNVFNIWAAAYEIFNGNFACCCTWLCNLLFSLLLPDSYYCRKSERTFFLSLYLFQSAKELFSLFVVFGYNIIINSINQNMGQLITFGIWLLQQQQQQYRLTGLHLECCLENSWCNKWHAEIRIFCIDYIWNIGSSYGVHVLHTHEQQLYRRNTNNRLKVKHILH